MAVGSHSGGCGGASTPGGGGEAVWIMEIWIDLDLKGDPL